MHFEQFCRLPRRPNLYTTQFELFSIWSLLETLLILLLLKVATSTFQDTPSRVPLFCSFNWIFSLSLFVDLRMMETCLTIALELNWTSQASMFFNWQEEPPLIVIYSRFTLDGSVPSMVSAGSDVFILMWWLLVQLWKRKYLHNSIKKATWLNNLKTYLLTLFTKPLVYEYNLDSSSSCSFFLFILVEKMPTTSADHDHHGFCGALSILLSSLALCSLLG